MSLRHLDAEDGTILHYSDGGAGSEALVFVHGWCSNLAHWQVLTRRFESECRILAVDRRGHGQSTVAANGYTAAQHAADLQGILDHERLRDTVLIAHAGGAPTALALAMQRPDLARAVVLIDTTLSPHTPLGRPGSPQRSALGRLIDQLEGPAAAETFEAMYRGFFSPHAGEVADRAVREACAVSLRVARAELASLAIDTEGMARSLIQPVLWIAAGPIDETRLAGTFRDVQFGRVVGSGHFPQLEVPDQVSAMISRFLATRPPGYLS